MDYFRSSLKTVLGASTADSQPSGAETIERLVCRVSTSTLLEDRRDACRALKALSRKHRLGVGAHAMDALRQVLELDRSDCEIISYCLDTLCNVTYSKLFEEEEEEQDNLPSNIGEQFAEMFIKNAENVQLVLGFVEEYDYRVRLPAVKLLTSLLASKPKEIQDIVLVSPMGVSKLIDLLSETRDVIRNEAVLLLINFTRSNANIQKIVAFENAFDRLFDIIHVEGGYDGGIVVEDCVVLMLNLLKNNSSNINFFKEGSYINKLVPLLKLPDNIDVVGWTPQAAANVLCILQLIRTLVSPSLNSATLTSSCQKVMRTSGLLSSLCALLMADGIPADILTETMSSVAEAIRGHLPNQELFSQVTAPCTPTPKPAIIVMLMSLVNDKQPFHLRCAVLYCFQCYLNRNEAGQHRIVDSMLGHAAVDEEGAGHLLCAGLFSNTGNGVSSWLSAVALMYCLVENGGRGHRERLLQVQIGDVNAGSLQPMAVGLLQQCFTFVQQSRSPTAKIGHLMLISMWLAHCTEAVRVLLQVPAHMAYLTTQCTSNSCDHDDDDVHSEMIQLLCTFIVGLCILFNDNSVPSNGREELVQMLDKRMGLESYTERLGQMSKHEMYARAAKQPQIRADSATELLLEYEFCRLFKSMETKIVKILGDQTDITNGVAALALNDSDNALFLQYNEFIREQDRKWHELHHMYQALQQENAQLQEQVSELQKSNALLQDQNVVLRAQLVTGDGSGDGRLQEMLRAKQEELDKVRHDQDELLELLTDQDQKLSSFKSRLRELGDDFGLDDDVDDECDAHELTVSEAEECDESNQLLLQPNLPSTENVTVKHKEDENHSIEIHL